MDSLNFLEEKEEDETSSQVFSILRRVVAFKYMNDDFQVVLLILVDNKNNHPIGSIIVTVPLPKPQVDFSVKSTYKRVF